MKIPKAIDMFPNHVKLIPLISPQMVDNLKVSMQLFFHFYTRLQNTTEVDAS